MATFRQYPISPACVGNDGCTASSCVLNRGSGHKWSGWKELPKSSPLVKEGYRRYRQCKVTGPYQGGRLTCGCMQLKK